MARTGELAPNTVQSGVFKVKYKTKMGLWKKFVDVTIEMTSNSEHNLLSVSSNSKTEYKDPITFPLNPSNKEMFLRPSNLDCNDPRTLTRFRILGLSKRMDSFQCDTLLQFHRLYASTGEGLGEPGLFSSPDLPSVEPLTWVRVSQEFGYDHEDMLGRIDRARINSNPKMRPLSRPSTPPPTYNEAIKRFPMAYYRPEDVHTFPVFTVPTAPPLSRSVDSYEHISPRDQHDTFLPPYGMPLSYPISLGFGPEVGLEEDIQEIFDPTDDTIFYLNHKNYKFIIDDPRLPNTIESEPTVIPQVIRVSRPTGTVRIPGLSFSHLKASDGQVEEMANLAVSRWEKYSGFQVKMSGQDGECGINGVTGQRGFFGCRGADGRFYGGPADKGQDGKDGASGTHGLPGKDGTNGADLYINLSGDANKLLLSGDITDELDMGGDSSYAILYIDISGGKGGRGGRGGHGGPGGRGGMGGHGHKGMVGIDAMIPGGAGGAGQSGGRGGRGGIGGDGGDGGRGGDGGNGGSGGRLIISCKDPSLFSLVEVNCRGGEGGKGGRGGNGGERGEGGKGGGGGDSGRGGMGGPGTDDSTAGFHGTAGKVGVVGEQGKPGSGGYRGTQGKKGEFGTLGSIMWVVLGAGNKARYCGNQKFNVSIIEESIRLYSAVDDDVFEPSERISVSGIQIRNSGDIPLSAGAKLRTVSSDTINFENSFVSLPEIAPNTTYNVNQALFGRIFDIPTPNTKEAFQSFATFTIQVDLNNRLVTESTTQSLKVQYPITFKNVTYPEMQGRGEARPMKILLQNVSNQHYGSSNGSGGHVSLDIHLDKRLVPVGYFNNPDNKEYDVYYDHFKTDSIHVVVKELKPRSCLLIDLNLFLVADVEIYDKCLWQIDLLLRRKLIQYRYGYVEVSPGKMGHIEVSDNSALLVVSLTSMSRLELLFWESILSGLGLDIHYWDLSCYRSFQTETEVDIEDRIDPATNWSQLFRGKLVVFPHANLAKISVSEMIAFFHGDDWERGLDVDCDSGMFFLMNTLVEGSNRINLIQKFCGDRLCNKKPEVRLSERQASNQLRTAQQNPRNSVFPQCVINPTSELWDKKCKVVKLMFSKSATFCPLSGNDRDIIVAEFPLARFANFFMLDVTFPRKENFKFDNPHIEPHFDSVPFGSNLGQSILCVVSALPTSMKIHILMTFHSAPLPCNKWKLITPSGFTVNVMDLIYMTLSNDLMKEIKYSQNELRRFEYFREMVCSHPHTFTDSSTARYTMAIILILQSFAKKSLKAKPDMRSYVECGCEQMSQTILLINQGNLSLTTERRAFLKMDLFFDSKVIFTPEQLHPYDGYVST